MKLPGRKKIVLIFSVLSLLIGIGVLCYFVNPYYWFLENHYSKIYDWKNPQKPVTSYDQIDQVLESFEQVPYAKLDSGYLHYSKSELTKYKQILVAKKYYAVRGNDIFRFLVGTFRVKDFLAEDKFYRYNLLHLDENEKQYFLIDKKLLYALLDLQTELEKAGHNKEGFSINYAHRHPMLNVEVGGASVSYHIRGQAIDLVIGDVNQDGRATQEDKKIVLDILENKIIREKGGIGRYPWSMVVHFDVRGYKARWDRQ